MSAVSDLDIETWILGLLSEYRLRARDLFAERSFFEEALNRKHIGASEDDIKRCLFSLIECSLVDVHQHVGDLTSNELFTVPTFGLTPLGGGVWLGRHRILPTDLIDVEPPVDELTDCPVLELTCIREADLLPIIAILTSAGFVRSTEYLGSGPFYLRYWYLSGSAVTCRIVGNLPWGQFCPSPAAAGRAFWKAVRRGVTTATTE